MRSSFTAAAVWLITFSLAAAVHAQPLDVLPDQTDGRPTTQMLTAYLEAHADAAFAERRAEYEQVDTAEDAREYQQRVKRLMLKQLGPLPKRTPLNAKTVGTLSGEGYRVEKIIFESQPRHYVTAILFLPTDPPAKNPSLSPLGKGRKDHYPGVVIPCGHSRSGKATQQRMCILLARHGIAALSYDPIGQGERYQLLDEEGEPRFKPTDEHTLLGATCILVGRNTATYRIWDGMRAIDYLAGRPEIDAERIGVTGCSGGGTLSSYLMALDERVVCAAPSCYLTSFPRLLETIGPQDAEQNIHAQIRLGIDHADYIHMRAPRPTLILASTRDFFDIEGTWDTFRQAKRFYTRLGHPERVGVVETDARHGYPQPQREAMLRWMSRWLQGRDEPLTEGEFETHSSDQVQCSPEGQVMRIEDARSVVDLNLELDRQLQAQRKQLWREGNVEKALAEVRQVTGIRELESLPEPKVRTAGKVQRDGYAIEKLILQPEEGVQLPALLFTPNKVTGGKHLYLHGLGKQADAQPGGPMEALVKDGHLVLAVDLRGSGETGPSKETMLGANWRAIFISYLLGRPMLSMRAEDILVCARYLADRTGESDAKEITVTAVGGAGPPALHAVALEPDLFASLALSGSLTAWSDYLHDPAMRGQMVNVVHGALEKYDLPDLIASLPEGKVTAE